MLERRKVLELSLGGGGGCGQARHKLERERERGEGFQLHPSLRKIGMGEIVFFNGVIYEIVRIALILFSYVSVFAYIVIYNNR